MDKIWFVLINNVQEGPFSFDDLKSDHRLTPDTLAWREGFTEWKKIREILELKELFQESSSEEEGDKDELKPLKTEPLQDELVLDMGQAQPPYILWLLLALITLLYVVLKLYTHD